MGVSVKSNCIPQPAQLKHAPYNSLNIPNNAASNTPLRNTMQQQQQAQAQRILPALPKIAAFLNEGTKRGLGYALAGLGTIGLIGGGAMYLKKKRKENRLKETDDLWRSAILNQQGMK